MNRPLNEQDEFLLSRLLDNDLPPDEAADLRARMEREPQLRKAYEATTRIDSLLAARRADQPQINWSAFHRQVMAQVEAQTIHQRTIRLADFLRVALPLAAAAAIALVVWFWPHRGQITPGEGMPTPRIAVNNPPGSSTPEPEPTLLVRYHRSGATTAAEEPVVVRYARSDGAIEEYKAMDGRNQAREPWQTFMVGDARPTRIPRELLNAISPL